MKARAVFGLLCAFVSCSAETARPQDVPLLLLSRDPREGAFELELRSAPKTPRAVEVELLIDSKSAYLLEDAGPPTDLPLDSVRALMRETNRAVLFAGDKQGIRLRRSGVVARFFLRPVSPPGAGGSIRIERALVVDEAGEALPVEIGSPLALR